MISKTNGGPPGHFQLLISALAPRRKQQHRRNNEITAENRSSVRSTRLGKPCRIMEQNRSLTETSAGCCQWNARACMTRLSASRMLDYTTVALAITKNNDGTRAWAAGGRMVARQSPNETRTGRDLQHAHVRKLLCKVLFEEAGSVQNPSPAGLLLLATKRLVNLGCHYSAVSTTTMNLRLSRNLLPCRRLYSLHVEYCLLQAVSESQSPTQTFYFALPPPWEMEDLLTLRPAGPGSLCFGVEFVLCHWPSLAEGAD